MKLDFQRATYVSDKVEDALIRIRGKARIFQLKYSNGMCPLHY